MSNRGYFSGMSWHTEYHTLERKKEKTADCKYLDENRMCLNGKSPCFMSKCFEATMCIYRVREYNSEIEDSKNNNKPKAKQKKRNNTQRCSLPIGCKVINGTYGMGKYVSYDKEKSLMTIKFGFQESKFKYPDAIEKGFLKVDAEIMDKYVHKDIRKNTNLY